MDLTREFQEQINAYLEGRTSLAALRAWMDLAAQEIVETDDDGVATLADRAWVLFAELDHGHRDEASVRAELGKHSLFEPRLAT